MPKLTFAESNLLSAMVDGASLKAHRTLDGDKTHFLHPLAGEPEPVKRSLVESLARRGLIASNMKFPVATYMLTEEGVRRASWPADR